MHLGMYVCSQGIEPITFSAANVMLYHWDTGTWPLKLLTWVKVHPKMEIAANLVYFFCWETKESILKTTGNQTVDGSHLLQRHGKEYLRLMATVN